MSAKVAPDPGLAVSEGDASENGKHAANDNSKKGNAVAGMEVPDCAPPKPPVARKSTGLFQFSNTDAIKEKVRQSTLRIDPYNVHNFYHETGFFQKVAKHHYFENTTLAIIVVNAGWISIDTDLNTADTINDAHGVFIAADIMFFVYFSIELLIRFLAFKRKKNCLKDGWFRFDSALVFLYAFDPFAIGIIAKISGGGGLDLPTAVLRLFRLARLSRLVRMLRSLPELMIMIKGMMSAAKTVNYTLGLLMLITYVFSIALRNLVPNDSDIESDFFISVPEAMHSLIVFGTFLDALADFIIPIKEQSTACFILTWIYIAVASMTVMNMLIGVLCEVISAVATEERESMIVDKVNEKFQAIFNDLDNNHDGEISWAEFQQLLEYPEAIEALESVNVDPESMIDTAADFFFDDGEPVAVTVNEFMEMVLDLRQGQIATVSNIMSLGKRFSGKVIGLKTRFDEFEARLCRIDEKLDELMDDDD